MIILVMGTTGAGKTTVGELLARRLGWTFLDADDFHPAANVKKMSLGIPLTDEDRKPWLAAIHAELSHLSASGKSCVLACSALKESYRQTLRAGLDVETVFLKGSYEEMKAHILGRHGHFAGEGILAGQFRDLEEPRDAVVASVSHSPEAIVEEILQKLKLA